jgi:hypothetical protein
MISNISGYSARTDQALSSTNASLGVVKSSQSQSQTENNSNLGQSTRVTLSKEALRQLGIEKDTKSATTSQSASKTTDYTPEQLKEIKELKARDSEVRAHELAHMMVGGTLVRKGVSYEYQQGPDGVRYAIGGEVSIDTSAIENDPSATIRKMEQVKRAALAPADPSPQDQSVAATAAQTEATARQQLRQQTTESNQSTSSSSQS